MSRLVDVKITKLHEDAIVPQYAHDGDAGFDIVTLCDTIIEPNTTAICKTGLAMAIPNGYEVQVRPRSGISLKGVDVTKLIYMIEKDKENKRFVVVKEENGKEYIRVQLGTIDCQYRGEIGIIAHNTSNDVVVIPKGTRLAQGVLNEVPQANFIIVEKLDDTDRGQGGFGSTGTSVK